MSRFFGLLLLASGSLLALTTHSSPVSSGVVLSIVDSANIVGAAEYCSADYGNACHGGWCTGGQKGVHCPNQEAKWHCDEPTGMADLCGSYSGDCCCGLVNDSNECGSGRSEIIQGPYYCEIGGLDSNWPCGIIVQKCNYQGWSGWCWIAGCTP
jgi:hypothetical protein